MLDAREVIQNLPRHERFCSVQELHGFIEHLRGDNRFVIEVAGTSVNGVPIYHVRCGTGLVKALLVGGPHAMEPIGALTTLGLISLLQQGNRALLAADVEWHIVPCIDPDGAILNEEWTQQSFTLESYMKGYYQQAPADQADLSFPIAHGKLVWNEPSREARILQRLLERIRPDFYFPLHNASMTGTSYCLSREIEPRYYQALHELLSEHRLPLQRRPVWKEVCMPFDAGIIELVSIRKICDYLERITPSPEKHLQHGECSWAYLAEIKPEALTFVAEVGYVRHPACGSQQGMDQNLRKFKLRLEADSKFLATLLLDEWERVQGDVDVNSPFYRAIVRGNLIPEREKLSEGGRPLSRYPTRDTLFNPQYDRTMTEGELYDACMVDGGFYFLLQSHQFIRLLLTSPQTAAVRQAIDRLEPAFAQALAELARHVDFDSFEVIDCDTLARVQLGSGLIVLDSLLGRTAVR